MAVQYRPRLRALVEVRMPPRLSGRLDASDVVQVALVEATQRFDEHRRNPALSPYLWLRFITLQRLKIVCRRHLQTQKRAADREAVLPELEVSSVVLAKWLVDAGRSPSESVLWRERQEALHQSLEKMAPQDREMLTLRHFEQLSNAETAEALGISVDAARQRYYRALERLEQMVGPLLSNQEP